MSPERGLKAEGPGKARLRVDLGVGAGISKVSDGSYQLIVEALISTATDASTGQNRQADWIRSHWPVFAHAPRAKCHSSTLHNDNHQT